MINIKNFNDRQTAKSDLIDSIIVARDKYTRNYKTVYDNYRISNEYLNENFRKGTPYYNEELRKIEGEFESGKAEIKEGALEFVSGAISEIRGAEIGRVCAWDDAAAKNMQRLDLLKDYTLTPAEIRVLCQELGNKDYLLNKALQSLADKNGVELTGLESGIDNTLEELDKLEHNFNAFIEGYKGEETAYNIITLCSDKALFESEKALMNNITVSNLTFEQIGQRVATEINTANNIMSRGLALSNAFNNGNDLQKAYILYMLAAGDIKGIDNKINNIDGVGIGEIIEKFKDSGDFEKFGAALKVYDKSKSLDKAADIRALLLENNDNDYVEMMFSDSEEYKYNKALGMETEEENYTSNIDKALADNRKELEDTLQRLEKIKLDKAETGCEE